MKTIIAVLFSSLTLSTISHADNAWYGVFSAGKSKFKISENDINSSLADAGLTTIAASNLDEDDKGFKLQAGYRFNENFAVEGGFVDLGKLHYHADATSPMLAVGGFHVDASASVHAFGVNVDALGILPVGAGFSLFAKAGVIAARTETRLSVGIADDNTNATDVKPTFGIGAEYAMTDKLGVRLEFERFSKLGDKNKTGEADVDLASIGLVAKF